MLAVNNIFIQDFIKMRLNNWSMNSQ